MAECRVAAIVQARMSSSRLPGKVLARVCGKTLLEHLIERLRQARTLSKILVATTDRPSDDAVEAEATRLGIPCFRGDEDDVLSRYEAAASSIQADVIVRITADCPLLDPAEVDKVATAFLTADPPVDYASNLTPIERRIPLGMSVEVMTRAALARAFREGQDKHHREHVTPYLYESPGRFSTLVVHPPQDLSHLRLTVDTAEDLSVVTEVLEAIDGKPNKYSLDSALEFLEANPHVALRNVNVRQKKYDETSSSMDLRGLSLLIRADATQDIGAGHAMRCFAIAEAWARAGGRAAFFGHLPPAFVARFIQANISVITSFPPEIPIGSAEDAAATRKMIDAGRHDVLLLDGYAFGTTYLEALHKSAPVVAYIDDFAQRDLPVDVIIDPNVGATEGSRGDGITVLAGGAFTPLRAEIADARVPQRSFDTSPRTLLLTFGASDPARLSLLALRAAMAVSRRVPLRIIVLAGPLNPDIESLSALAIPDAVTIAGDTQHVAPLFCSADLAFAAAGSTCFELAALGVPMLLVQVADNQRAVIDPLIAAGVAQRIEIDTVKDEVALEKQLEAFVTTEPSKLCAQSIKARRLVDGQGATRIARSLGALAIQKAKAVKESS